MHTDEGVRAGLSADEARRQALIRLGGEEQVRQAYRDRATLPPLEGVLQDVRFALRQMRKAPGFTITAVLTLALGIGANAVIYTLVDSILLRPLPYAQQDRLMRITGEKSPVFPKGWIRELGKNSKAFESISGYGPDAESNLSDSGAPDRVFGAKVIVNAFKTLGIRPALGDFFSAQDAIAGQDNDIILSYGYWRQHYGGAPDVIGRTLRVDGVSRRIIGVMPVGVHFPYADTQFVIPVSYRGDAPLDPWSNFDLQAFGRLADGVTPAQAQAELRRLHSILLPVFPFRMPDVWASDMTVVPLLEAQTGGMRPRLVVAFWRSGTDSADCVRERGEPDAGARNGPRARDCDSRRAGRVGKEAHSATALGERRAGCGGRCGRAGRGICEPARFCGIAAGRYSAYSRCFAACQGHSVYLGASVLAGLLFGLIPAIKMASLNLLATLRVGKPRIDRTRLAVRVVDGTGDGADWPFGHRDYRGRT